MARMAAIGREGEALAAYRWLPLLCHLESAKQAEWF
jgi:hypothetical protein